MLAEFLYKLSSEISFLNIFKYVSVKASFAFATALLISWIFGPWFIGFMRNKQIGETIREDGPASHNSKAGTPTMGGVIILVSIVVSVLLWTNLKSVSVMLVLGAMLLSGLMGFVDDYIKVILKDKKGLRERFKLIGQVIIGVVVGAFLTYYPELHNNYFLQTSVPFLKDYTINFYYPAIYILFAVIVVFGTTNSVNFTDGLDGLAAGTSAIAFLGFAGIAYVSGHLIFSDYLNIMFIKDGSELAIFSVAIIGATLGFLWFNAHPAEIFMGDTGSLALGTAISVIAILLKKELWLLIIGGIFLAEGLSSFLQRFYFKFTRKVYGEPRRLFRMAPLHHHFEKGGMPETKVVARFYIVAVLLILITLTTFKTQ
jgi:phospho-N-acetylmuramoyl-pentapeptide-transferase